MKTIRDLLEHLDGLDPDLPIVLQKDSEGNGYRFYNGASEESYYKTRYGLEVITQEDIIHYDDCNKCIVLW